MDFYRHCAWSVQFPWPGKGSFKTCQVLGVLRHFLSTLPADLRVSAVNPFFFRMITHKRHLTGLNMGLCRHCAWSVQFSWPGKGSFKTCQVLGGCSAVNIFTLYKLEQLCYNNL
jgi:hypothetical protein